MSIVLDGNGGVFADVDGTTFRTQKIVSKPIEYGVNGHFSVAAFQGNFAGGLATSSEIFQFQWTDPRLICIINRVRFSAAIASANGSGGTLNQWILYKATGWITPGTFVGGANILIPAGQNKLRSSMASTQMGVAGTSLACIHAANTAALGAGTKTIEPDAIGFVGSTYPSSGAGPMSSIIVPAGTVLFESNVANGVHPLILGYNEGFTIISNQAPATGGWACMTEVQWTELAPVQPLAGY